LSLASKEFDISRLASKKLQKTSPNGSCCAEDLAEAIHRAASPVICQEKLEFKNEN